MAGIVGIDQGRKPTIWRTWRDRLYSIGVEVDSDEESVEYLGKQGHFEGLESNKAGKEF